MKRIDSSTGRSAFFTAPLVLLPLVGVVQVQLWTLAAAVGAAFLATLAYLLRRAFGLVKPVPPPEEDTPH